MRYGRGALPDGFLPVFSVNSEVEAERLLILCCPRGADGQFYARELANEQTLDNLQAFSDRLAAGYALLKKRRP